MANEQISGPAYRVVTPRLVIRCWDPKDAALMKEAIDTSIDHLLPWMPWAADEPQRLADKIAHLRQFRGRFDLDENFVYGILNREETRVLGGSGLHPRVGEGALEIGYWIRKDAINHGYASECTAALTRVAFEIHAVQRVEIHCDPANVASATVPRKLGFTHECTRRQNYHFGETGPWRDSMVWTMLRDEYQSSPCAGAALEAYDVIGNPLEMKFSV